MGKITIQYICGMWKHTGKAQVGYADKKVLETENLRGKANI